MAKRAKRTLAEDLLDIAKGLGRVTLFFYVPVVTLMVIAEFPYDVDPSLYPQAAKVQAASNPNSPKPKRSAEFYEVAYKDVKVTKGVDYELTATNSANVFHVTEKVQAFVDANGLKNKKVLEVGSGRGYLQDLVDDYTGLDLSPTVAHHYHKKFVVGSATNMPFPDNSFDAIWTVWVFEHIPEPEKAMREMRRVLKPGGKLYLHVAWQCQTWFADGFDVRPYSDFNWKGKLVKASLMVRGNPWFQSAYILPTRVIRLAQYEMAGKNMPLHFRALEANYDVYWQPDSDASTGIDSYEAYLWHRAQGDVCTNCRGPWQQLAEVGDILTFEIRK